MYLYTVIVLKYGSGHTRFTPLPPTTLLSRQFLCPRCLCDQAAGPLSIDYDLTLHTTSTSLQLYYVPTTVCMTRLRAPLSTRCSSHTVPSKKETGKIADSVNKILMGYVCKGKGVFKVKTLRFISISYNAGSFQIAVSFIRALR